MVLLKQVMNPALKEGKLIINTHRIYQSHVSNAHRPWEAARQDIEYAFH